jgi:hypothetical protein
MYLIIVFVGFLLGVVNLVAWWVLFNRNGMSGWWLFVPIVGMVKCCRAAEISGLWAIWILWMTGVSYGLNYYYTNAAASQTIDNQIGAAFGSSRHYVTASVSPLSYLLILLAGIAATAPLMIGLSRSQSRSKGFTVGAVVFPYIATPVIAFSE